jgi:hypothetical protein
MQAFHRPYFRWYERVQASSSRSRQGSFEIQSTLTGSCTFAANTRARLPGIGDLVKISERG